MKKIISTCALLLLILLPVAACTPHRTIKLESDSGDYRVELGPKWNTAVAVFDRKDTLLHEVSVTDVFTYFPPFVGKTYTGSTAGIDWYINSIRYIHPGKPLLIVRHRLGRYLMIDLDSGEAILPTQALREEANDTVTALALTLLDSEDPGVQEIGCIHSGHLRNREAIPRLRELLDDDNYIRTKPDDRELFVYYVRKEAVTALHLMGEDVSDIVYEYYPETVTHYSSIERGVISIPNTAEALKEFRQREKDRD